MTELPKHFSCNLESIKSNPSSIIQGDKYRFTVLSDILIRLEYSETGTFEDRPTELVTNRNFKTVDYKVNQDNKYLTISTNYFTLTYQKGMPFVGSKVSPDQYLRIDLNETDKFWYINHPEARNFKGTTYNLDNADGKVKFGKGLYSTDGFVAIDDSNSLIMNESGTYGIRNDKRLDFYVFMYRRDFGACLRDYFTLTGFPPLIPRYALGVWWNRNTTYTYKDIEKLIFKFNKYRIPVSVLMLGDKWHKQNPKLTSGLSFNEELLKNPKKLTDFLHNKGIRLCVSINPLEGISPKEDYFLPFKSAIGETKEGIIPFNVFSSTMLNAYFDYFIHPLMNNGIDFFWINNKEMNDLRSIRALTRYHFDDFKQITNRRGIVMSRIGGIATHRYPIHYTGETYVSWKNLEMLPAFNSTASNLGISWISNDIGGYKGGTEDGELYSRFIQFGCFSPILRLSAEEGAYYKREPWKWDITTESVCAKYLALRHSLIPYLYSEAYNYKESGLPLVQPLYYRYPEIYDEPDYKNEYYFGSNLFVAPITKKGDSVMERTVLKLFLPEGTWYDFTTGKRYVGGKRYTTFYKREDYPVFARSGTIIPLALLDEKNINDTSAPKNMEIQVFPGNSSSYRLYEDDGLSSLHEQGYFIKTQIDYSYQQNNFTIVIRPIEGKTGIIPEHRAYRIRFRNVREPDEVIVHIADEKVKGYKTYVDDNDFLVELPALSTLKQITVNCKGKNIEIDAARLINDDIDSILSDLAISTNTKNLIGEIVLSDMELKEKRIQVRKLKKHGVSDKYINLFLKLLEYLSDI